MWGMLHSSTFSILAGIIGPIVCFALQPLLLRGDDLVPPLRFINVFWLFGYGVIGLEMLVLALSLAVGTRLGAWNGLISGVLFAGALVAGGLGVVLLPFSLIGLLLIIGALGFAPFLTAAAYSAKAVEAYRQARGERSDKAHGVGSPGGTAGDRRARCIAGARLARRAFRGTRRRRR